MLDFEDISLLIIADAKENPKGHWQSLWERGYPLSTHITCSDTQSAEEWVQLIDQTIKNTGTPVIIAAHSIGVLAFAKWLYQAPLIEQKLIYGALLVAPISIQSSTLPAEVKTQILQARANFPTALICSKDDTYCSTEEAQVLSKSLSAKLYTMENAGHINAESGFGPWQWGMRLMQDIIMKYK